MKRCIIGAPNGGMGDRAPSSTLAERFTLECGWEVWWHDNFRNDGVRDFWLRDNPYVKGVTKDAATHCIQLGHEHFRLLHKHMSNVAAHEEFFGLPGPYNMFPRIYWTPDDDPRFHGKVLVDPSGISSPYTKMAFEPHIRALLTWGLFHIDDLVVMEPPNQALTHARVPTQMPAGIFPECPRWRPADVFEQASAIYSCAYFCPNESGSTAMASAIKARTAKPEIRAIAKASTHNLVEWRWKNVDYYTQTKLSGDW